MNTIRFNGNASDFDSIYWEFMQGFEQYLSSNKLNKTKQDKVVVHGYCGEITCVRWIV